MSDPVTAEYGQAVEVVFYPATGYGISRYKINDGNWVQRTELIPRLTYSISSIKADTTIIAETALQEYSITYELRGGDLPEGKTNPEIYTVETERFTLDNPVRPGYQFVGWTTSALASTGTTEMTVEKGTTRDLTFYAVWAPATAQLTIATTCDDSDQSFIFTIVGQPEDAAVGTVEMDVVLVGNDSVTIRDLPVGSYTITEKDGWSWRQEERISSGSFWLDTGMTKNFAFVSVDRIYWFSDMSYGKSKKGGQ